MRLSVSTQIPDTSCWPLDGSKLNARLSFRVLASWMAIWISLPTPSAKFSALTKISPLKTSIPPMWLAGIG
jgi:hypothetical protein